MASVDAAFEENEVGIVRSRNLRLPSPALPAATASSLAALAEGSADQQRDTASPAPPERFRFFCRRSLGRPLCSSAVLLRLPVGSRSLGGVAPPGLACFEPDPFHCPPSGPPLLARAAVRCSRLLSADHFLPSEGRMRPGARVSRGHGIISPGLVLARRATEPAHRVRGQSVPAHWPSGGKWRRGSA